MCLENDPKEVRKLLASKKKEWTFYKVLKRTVSPGGIKLASLLYCDDKPEWTVGENKSSHKGKNERLVETSVYQGIHVYMTAEIATHEEGVASDMALVKVKCLAQDLLGADDRRAVFSKVVLDKKEFDKAAGVLKLDMLKPGTKITVLGNEYIVTKPVQFLGREIRLLVGAATGIVRDESHFTQYQSSVQIVSVPS